MHLMDNFLFHFYSYSIDRAKMNLLVNPKIYILSFLLLNADFIKMNLLGFLSSAYIFIHNFL